MLFRLSEISGKSLNSLSASFTNLPETDHKDGKYRLRRYSVVRCNGSCVDVEDSTFIQSDEYNKFQGNVERTFEPIENDIIDSIGMLEMCSTFTGLCGFNDDHEIGIHQMRVATSYQTGLVGGGETSVSPEGIHQDGYDYICIVGVNRWNIEGGELLSYMGEHEEPFVSVTLNPGMMAIINDRALWHNANSIRPVIGKDGYMDSFILTAKYKTDE